MRAIVFLCLLGAAVAQESSKYQWEGPGGDTEQNVCLTDQSSCGCCLMQKQMARMEQVFNTSLNNLQKDLEKTQNALDNVRASRSAFSVALTDAHLCLGPFRDVQMVVYETTFLNLGDGYNNGVFTAPRSGVYVLSVTVYSDDGGGADAPLSACVSLTVNGREVARPSEMNKQNEQDQQDQKDQKDQQDQQDSATVVLPIQLTAGDRVAVYLPSGCFLCDDGNHYNTFSGFLLYATD